MGINTPGNSPEIKTLKDIEEKMCPVFKEGVQHVQPYLIKRFLKIYGSLKDGTQQLDDDTLEELNMIREDYLKHKAILHEAMVGSFAAIMSRNLSHNVGENLIFPNTQFQEFLSYCDIDQIELKTLGSNKFETLLQKNAESLKNHILNRKYVELRNKGKSPIEAIKMLPWGDIMMANMLHGGLMLPSNEDILEGSKMGNTDYCLGRVNTIIGIIVLNEGVDYLNQHFKYADVLKDSAEDIMQLTPRTQRDSGYLGEYLGIEDPHQILIYVDDDGTEQDIDTNQIGLEQQVGQTIPGLKNITKVYNGETSQIAYEIFFLNYLNTYFSDLTDLGEKEKLVKYIELCNKKYGVSYTLLKWIMNYAIDMDNPQKEKESFEEIKKLAEEYPCIKDTLAYQLSLNETDISKINDFIRKKYGPQFNFSDIQSQLGLG